MGRLIGLKHGTEVLEFLGADLGNLDTVTDCYGSFCDNLFNKLCFGV